MNLLRSIIGNTPGITPPLYPTPASPGQTAAPTGAGQVLSRSTVGVPSDPVAAAAITRSQGELARQAAGESRAGGSFQGQVSFGRRPRPSPRGPRFREGQPQPNLQDAQRRLFEMRRRAATE